MMGVRNFLVEGVSAMPAKRELVERLHRTKEDIPADATVIDATAPLTEVVDGILRRAGRSEVAGD